MARVIPYSNLITETAAVIETAPDGTLRIDVPPRITPRLPWFHPHTAPLFAMLVVSLFLCSVVSFSVGLMRSHSTKAILIAMALFAIDFGVAWLIAYGRCFVDDPHLSIRTNSTDLYIEKTSRSKGREYYQWTRRQVTSVMAEPEPQRLGRRDSLCIRLRDGVLCFMSDRPKSEIDEVAAAICQAMKLD